MHNHLPPSLRLATLAAVFAMVCVLHRARAQDVERIAEREVMRRQAASASGTKRTGTRSRRHASE